LQPALRASLLLLLVAVGCAPGPRLRGPSFGSQGEPFLSSRVAKAIDRTEDPVQRLILIGDAGAPLPEDPTLATLRRWADVRPERTTVVFLGDNLYPDGLRQDDRPRGEAVLRQQLQSTRARRIFVPGNHDWGYAPGVLQQVGRLRAEEEFVDSHAGAEFQPKSGCPGPVARTLVAPGAALARGLTLVIVDFHWWLLPEATRPKCEGVVDTAAFLDRLKAELKARAGENVIVAAHHPLRSGGTHGGLTRGFWMDVGAGIFYRLYGSLQDLWEPTYAEMVTVVSAALAEHKPLAFVAGHDHSLQILEGGDLAQLLVVSGAGSAGSITGVTSLDETLFAHAHPGFVVLDFFEVAGTGGALLVRVVETGAESPIFTLGVDLEAAEAQALP
jgi:hypothetical protein